MKYSESYIRQRYAEAERAGIYDSIKETAVRLGINAERVRKAVVLSPSVVEGKPKEEYFLNFSECDFDIKRCQLCDKYIECLKEQKKK